MDTLITFRVLARSIKTGFLEQLINYRSARKSYSVELDQHM